MTQIMALCPWFSRLPRQKTNSQSPRLNRQICTCLMFMHSAADSSLYGVKEPVQDAGGAAIGTIGAV